MSRRSHPADWDDYVRELGLNLQRRRLALALSQEDVAYAAGLTRSHYQQLEKGRSRPDLAANPSLLTLSAVAAALNLEVSELLPDGPVDFTPASSRRTG
jgi:transcriptional regulator with XRE-family HTH domain